MSNNNSSLYHKRLKQIWSVYFPLDDEDFDPNSPKVKVIYDIYTYFKDTSLTNGGKQFINTIDWATDISMYVDFKSLLRTCKCVNELQKGIIHHPNEVLSCFSAALCLQSPYFNHLNNNNNNNSNSNSNRNSNNNNNSNSNRNSNRNSNYNNNNPYINSQNVSTQSQDYNDMHNNNNSHQHRHRHPAIKKYNFRLHGFEPTTMIKDIKSNLISQFISIKGIVVRVSKVNLMVLSMDFECTTCGEYMTKRFSHGNYDPPTSCINKGNKCKSRHFQPIYETAETIDLQMIKYYMFIYICICMYVYVFTN